MMKHILTIAFLFVASCIMAQTITLVEQGKPTSIRGLSVVDNNIAWVSGSKGHVGISNDGGRTWAWQQVKGFEQSDFRDIEAFSNQEAIIMSSGTPAVILKTIDGGQNWKVCYRNDDKAYFLDGMDFFDDKNGMIMGDPINNKFVVMRTIDGGDTWSMLPDLPETVKDEAAFAASGTTIKMTGKNSVTLLSGGARSRLFTSKDLKHWTTNDLPIAQGQASIGGFSFAIGGGRTVVVGGDYLKNKKADSVACFKIKDGKIELATQMPAGYQSGVVYLAKDTFLSTGTSGTNITSDGGITWKPVDATSYNVCQRAKKGNVVILAGDKGKIAIFKR